jgi:hypothetical protein
VVVAFCRIETRPRSYGSGGLVKGVVAAGRDL